TPRLLGPFAHVSFQCADEWRGLFLHHRYQLSAGGAFDWRRVLVAAGRIGPILDTAPRDGENVVTGRSRQAGMTIKPIAQAPRTSIVSRGCEPEIAELSV